MVRNECEEMIYNLMVLFDKWILYTDSSADIDFHFSPILVQHKISNKIEHIVTIIRVDVKFLYFLLIHTDYI
mgnify:FL=1